MNFTDKFYNSIMCGRKKVSRHLSLIRREVFAYLLGMRRKYPLMRVHVQLKGRDSAESLYDKDMLSIIGFFGFRPNQLNS